jgi:hypothetical protein
MGSAAVGAWIAYLTFIALIAVGVASGELGVRGLLVTLLVCVLARVGLGYVPNGDALFPSAVAVVDVALVLVIVKGDVRF